MTQTEAIKLLEWNVLTKMELGMSIPGLEVNIFRAVVEPYKDDFDDTTQAVVYGFAENNKGDDVTDIESFIIVYNRKYWFRYHMEQVLDVIEALQTVNGYTQKRIFL